ncbi:MAG: hypothetical protein WCG51_06155 [Elusimicrobiota bacterium]
MKYILCGVLLLLASFAFAGQPDVQFSVDRSTITIGDPVRGDIAVTLSSGTTLAPPEKPAEIGPWTVQDLATAPDSRDPLVTHIIYTLTTYTTGQVVIPPIAVVVDPAHALKTQPITITVASVLDTSAPAGDIRDIKPPLTMRLPLSAYVPWIVLALAILGGASWWYRRYQKRLAAKFPQPEVPRVPPEQLALERLAQLTASPLLSEGNIHEFYIILSDIIRDYLAGVYAIETRDMTTGEIYAQLRLKETDKKIRLNIKSFFDACDLVKFAKYRPDASGAGRDFEQAENIVTGKAL